MGSPYPLHYTLRWPYYYYRPSVKNHTGMAPAPARHDFFSCENKQFLRLIFCGDIMLTQKDMVPVLHPEISALISSADYFIGNCEAPVGAHGLNPRSRYHLIYHMPEVFLSGIISQTQLPAKRWILSVANNHAGDKGREAFYASVKIMRDIGVTPVGHLSDPGMPMSVLETHGIRLGVAAWTHWLNCEVFSRDEGIGRTEHVKRINWREVRQSHKLDCLAGLPHWEYEFQHFPRRDSRQLARSLIDDAGFVLLVGAHPHTLMPLEWMEKGICAYSLGNFSGLGTAWPVRLIPLLEVKIALSGEQKGKISGYHLHYFAQVNSRQRMDMLPLYAIEPSLRRKFLERMALVFE